MTTIRLSALNDDSAAPLDVHGKDLDGAIAALIEHTSAVDTETLRKRGKVTCESLQVEVVVLPGFCPETDEDDFVDAEGDEESYPFVDALTGCSGAVTLARTNRESVPLFTSEEGALEYAREATHSLYADDPRTLLEFVSKETLAHWALGQNDPDTHCSSLEEYLTLLTEEQYEVRDIRELRFGRVVWNEVLEELGGDLPFYWLKNNHQ